MAVSVKVNLICSSILTLVLCNLVLARVQTEALWSVDGCQVGLWDNKKNNFFRLAVCVTAVRVEAC